MTNAMRTLLLQEQLNLFERKPEKTLKRRFSKRTSRLGKCSETCTMESYALKLH